ncbi:3'-5' exonuclease [Streptomyces hirsutus]|uniref:3'-5' exonuclease n=1 Tax=Streptomyces hirsutus TaxID=35620 RepID=UPI00331E0211
MYSTAAALALDADLVRSVVAERLAWEAASLPRDAAAERIGWHWSDLDRMGREGRITTGRGGRYLIADLDRLQPGRAAVVDTETTDLFGRTVEIAVIDAATGKKLMDTLVDPGDAEISDGARWVHGITDEMVADARPFEKILPRLRKVTKGRTICVYSAEYDRTVVLKDVERAGKSRCTWSPGTTGTA